MIKPITFIVQKLAYAVDRMKYTGLSGMTCHNTLHQKLLFFFLLGLVGILFPDESELAYSVHRIWLAIGLSIGFVIGEFLHLTGQCYFMLAAITVAVISNLVLEFKTQSRTTLLPCCKSANYSISLKQVSKVGNDHAKA